MKGKKYIFLLLALFLFTQETFAVCGSTDYSGSSGRLYNMVVYVLAMCSYVMQLMYAIATLFSLYSATSIYIKMQAGEEGFTKSIIMFNFVSVECDNCDACFLRFQLWCN